MVFRGGNGGVPLQRAQQDQQSTTLILNSKRGKKELNST